MADNPAAKVDPIEKDEPERKEPLPNNEEKDELEQVKILPEGELTPEEQALKDRLEHYVAVVIAGKPVRPEVQGVTAASSVKAALDLLKAEIQSSTSSLTAVPKPLKHLRPHLQALKDAFKKDYHSRGKDVEAKLLADILSVISMVSSEDNRDCLRFKLVGNAADIGAWGDEYIRALAGDVAGETEAVSARTEDKMNVETFPPAASASELETLIDHLVPFQVERNLESDAIDMLFDSGKLSKIVAHTNDANFERLALYLVRLADYTTDAAETETVLRTAFEVYMSRGEFFDALRVALRFSSKDWVKEAFAAARQAAPAALGRKKLMRKQMAALMGYHRAFWYADEEDSDLEKIVSNARLSDLFRRLARELNVEEAKTPEDVYKSHLSETGGMRREATQAQVESARQNLASTFVNAFVNCGFIKDSLITAEGNPFIYKNKDTGMISATASLGLVLLWDVDEGMSQIDKFLYSTDKNIKAGALLALGLVGCGVRDDCEPALGMLPGYLDASYSPDERNCAALGLGLAYAANPKSDVSDALTPVVHDEKQFETSCIAALSLGFAFCGTGDAEVSQTLAMRLMELPDTDLDKSSARLLVLGLALVFLGKQDGADALQEILSTITHPITRFAKTLLAACAYAGSGNVLEVQKFLHACAGGGAKKAEEDAAASGAAGATVPAAPAAAATGPAAVAAAAGAANSQEGDANQPDRNEIAKQNVHQSAAVIGIALVTMGEAIGRAMAERSYQHLLQYGDVAVRRAVPLALALSFASNPDFNVVDVLSRLTHDADIETAMCAILALGIVGSGTNNSRIAGLLRLLASFYAKDANPLFVVRLAQGLLHAGKGLVTLSPYHSDRFLMLQPAICGLLTILVCSLDLKSSILGKLHYLMFALAPALRPRMVYCVDENLTPMVGVSVRVGTSVDVVGQAGKPKTITGFQTHTSPALMNVGERTEFSEPERWHCAARVLEGIVLLEKAPEDVEMKE